jgi:hypothetical protein
MNEWKPDEKFLSKLEKVWAKDGLDEIDPVSINLNGTNLESMLKLSESDTDTMTLEYVDYMRQHFDLKSQISPRTITLRESLNQMKKGDTAFGVIRYLTAYTGGWQNYADFQD